MIFFIEFILNRGFVLTAGFLLLLVARKFLPLRWTNLPCRCLLIYLMAYAGSTVIFPEEVTGTYGSFVLLAVLLLIFFKGDWYIKLSAAVILFPVAASVSYVTQDIGSLIWLRLFHRDMEPLAETALHSFTIFLRIPVWYLIYRYIRNWIPYTVRSLTPKMWLILNLISLTSFVGIISIVYKCTSYTSYIAYPTCLACIITSLGCCYLCTYMAKIVRSDMEIQTLHYQQSYYQELEKNQQAVRKLRHDMKNHLNIIRTFLHNRDLDGAENYFRELDHEIVPGTKVYCPNSIVNAVLNTKEQLAQSEEIAYTYQVDLNESPAIDSIDLCSLLSNTLDNAIEACRKIPDVSQRFFTVKARCKNGYFSYEIVNSKNNEVRTENGIYKTDKQDLDSHGIGLRNVTAVVEKYNGSLEISHTEDTFTVTVLIPALS